MAVYSSTLTLSASVIKAGDTLPVLTLTFADSDGPVDLSTATTIKVVMVGKQTATRVIGTCTAQEASHGTAVWAWTALNTATADVYSVEANVATSGGTQTFPNAAASNPQLEIDAQLDPTDNI